MTSNLAQLKQSVPTDATLVGSFFSGNRSHVQGEEIHCQACKQSLLPDAKFCGDCGCPAPKPIDVSAQNTANDQMLQNAAQPVSMPAFAQVSPKLRTAIPPAMKKEYMKLNTLLIRERFFLIAHYIIFLCANLFGFWTSFKAYHELFYADEISRTVMALFPLFFINCLALGCLVPIKGTKLEISRLKEKLTYLHYQIEYANL